ncbi:hypothetical protein [Lysinibacillus capsici]|uniref:hypothetical protein n=1 Tax=Lysinibacillus capsici TaxID=2115968 RepID=UPI000E20444E|nr:hypothetical protein [Lysinibacillus capsici]RDV26276.1 hypothetical protein C7B89_22020 [Lysinibacillus capsici]
MRTVTCNKCGEHLNKDDVFADFKNCFKCGSDDIEYRIGISDKIGFHETLKGKSKVPGKKKPRTEFIAGEEYSVRGEKWVEKQRYINRDEDIYYERVKDPDTGEVLHECSEPLTKHTGHGSAKHKKQ